MQLFSQVVFKDMNDYHHIAHLNVLLFYEVWYAKCFKTQKRKAYRTWKLATEIISI